LLYCREEFGKVVDRKPNVNITVTVQQCGTQTLWDWRCSW